MTHSRILTRHACQQNAAWQHTQGKGSVTKSLSVSLTLALAAFVGILLSFAV